MPMADEMGAAVESRPARRRLLGFVGILVLAAALVTALGLRELFASRPLALPAPVAIEVRDGDTLARVAATLERQGVIKHALGFRLAARLDDSSRPVQIGIYEFARSTTPFEALEKIQRGPDRRPLVVVPEGLTVAEIALLLEQRGFGRAERFRALAADPEFVRSLGVPGDQLEGYLFPNSYGFEVRMSEKEILTRFVKQFFAAFDEDLRDAATARGMSMQEAVTLASLIEKEAKVDRERSVISAVFHNRLARGMRLESDPTAVYDLPDHDGPVRPEHVRRASPFNTYQIRGLPPGPIANPGRASLEAAVRPAPDVKALYFVANDDGSHTFSATLREHSRAIDRARREAKAKPGS